MKERTIITLLPRFLVLLAFFLLVGCSQQKTGYEGLLDEQKAIVDNVYSQKKKWEKTSCHYGNIYVKGEFCLRDVGFSNSDGEIIFTVYHSLDESGSETIIRDMYKCSANSFKHIKSEGFEMINSNFNKRYYSTWEENRKLDYLANELLSTIK